MRLKTKKSKKIALVTAVILLASALIGGGVYWRQQSNDKAISNDGINYEPATEQEKKETEENKDRLASDNEAAQKDGQEQTNTQTTTKKNGDVTITFAGQYGDKIEVGAFVANIFEDGGTCSLKLSKGSSTITKEAAGFKNVSRTSCEPFSVDRSEFSQSGQWSVVVSYSSDSVSGTSSTRTIEVK